MGGTGFPGAGHANPVRFTKVSIPPGAAFPFVRRMLLLESGSWVSGGVPRAHGVVIASMVWPAAIVSVTTEYG